MSEFRRKIIVKQPVPIIADQKAEDSKMNVEEASTQTVLELEAETEQVVDEKSTQKRMKKVPVKERTEIGAKIWERISLGNYNPLDREELANLFCFVGWPGTQVVSQVINGKRSIVSFVKDDQTGDYLFDARDAYEHLKNKVKKVVNNQYTVGPFSKDTVELLTTIAKHKGIPVPLLITKMVNGTLADRVQKIESDLRKEFEERRKKLLKEVSIDI